MKSRPTRRPAARSRPAAKRSRTSSRPSATAPRPARPAATAAEPAKPAEPETVCDVVASILSQPAFRKMPPDAQLAFLENLAFLSGVLHYR